MWIKMSVKREAEMCQTQAGWPTIFSFEATQHTMSSREYQERPRQGRRQTEGIPARPAGRPHFAASQVHVRVEAMSTDPLAYN